MQPTSSLPSQAFVHTHGSSLRELGAPLDQERAASMADEGGVSGAIIDAQAQAQARAAAESDDRSDLARSRPLRGSLRFLPWAFAAVGAALALVLWRRH